ncbi:glycoside hydrolase superfamily [Scheffersomyces amazonensis]|uniref:glycoside hydrolase superfamily n=1 Tax=Scheffersomyces amazonensis TaxID=1078765 RepID=UPI00315CAF8F
MFCFNILAAISILSVLINGEAVPFPSGSPDYNTEANPQLPPVTFQNVNYTFPDCQNGPLKHNLVCNPAANYLDRAKALVSLFTLEELYNNTGNTSPGVPRLGVPAYQWWSEGLHGIASSPGVQYAQEGQFTHSTSFPQPILISAAFDDPLVQQIGTTISTEGRAFNNNGRAGLDYWTPNINPFRDQRWGRGQETPGEDPYRVSQYVYNLIDGLQGGIGPQDLKIAATCKHFFGYDIESWEGHSRLGYNAIINDQDLADYFLPPFQSCVRDAKVASTMCSYNAVNGVPSCANQPYLQNVLRDYYGLGEGVIVSDCDAIFNIWDPHLYADSPAGAAAAALKAGVDVNCGNTYQLYLGEAYSNGTITEQDLQTALIHQYGALIRLGYFDPAQHQPYRFLGWNDVSTPYAESLAYQAAAEGITLLKNDGTLPFSNGIKKLALIGPWANATTQMQGNYAGVAPYLISPLEGAQQAGYQVTYTEGTLINTTSTNGFAAALANAKEADAIVYLGGIDGTIEAEAQDRDSLTWPGNQLDLIGQLSALNKPLVVLQFGGGQVDDSSLKNNSDVNAIVWGGYPGQSGGKAVFDILKGTVSPAGRLPTTQYPAAYASEVAMTEMSVRPSSNNPGRTYQWYTGTPVYEFGYGLHYTNFTAQLLSPKNQVFNIATLIQAGKFQSQYADKATVTVFSIEVENVGKVTSDYSTLLFSNNNNGPGPYKNKELVSYQRLHSIFPGAKQVAQLPVTLGSLSSVDSNGNRYIYPGTYNFTVDTDSKTTFQITLNGSPTLIEEFPVNAN